MEPRHEHDCTACTFLGQFKEYDLYHCNQRGWHTVIARYGEGPEYISGLGFAESYKSLITGKTEFSEPLAEAKRRAIEAGLLEAQSETADQPDQSLDKEPTQ